MASIPDWRLVGQAAIEEPRAKRSTYRYVSTLLNEGDPDAARAWPRICQLGMKPRVILYFGPAATAE